MNKRKLIITTILTISLLAGFLPADCCALKRELVHNAKFEEMNVLRGIDVSHHQGDIDWQKVKKAGVQFAFIRVAGRYTASGTLFEDTKAAQNMLGAQEAGIPYGVYIYSQAISQKEAREEAAYLLERIKGYNVTLPVVLDFEYYQPGEGRLWDAHLSKSEATNVCLAFCRYVESAGYTPMVYANKSMLNDDMNATLISQDYPIWLAHYTSATNYAGDYTFWQYSQSGKVAGIDGTVDLNVWYQSNMNAVQGLSLTMEGQQLRLDWASFPRATGYEVWRRKGAEEYSLWAVNEDGITTYVDTEVQRDAVYVYKVRALLSETQRSDYSTPVAGCVGITKAPSIQKKDTFLNEITIVWESIPAAQSYRVERYNSLTNSYEEAGTTEIGSFTDSGLSSSNAYKYRVRAYRQVGGITVYGPYSNVLSVKTKATAKGKVTTDNLNVRAKATTSSKVLKTLKKNTILNLQGDEGDWYRITIQINGKKRQAYVSKKYIKIIQVKTPNITGKGNRFDRVRISWSEIAKADGYELQRLDVKKGKFITIKSTSKYAYTDKNLKASNKYQYRVRAYRVVSEKKIYSDYSTAITVTTKEPVIGKIKGKKVNLKKGAGEQYKTLKTVKKGKKVTVIGSQGDWYQIKIKIKNKNKTAYVHKKYLKL